MVVLLVAHHIYVTVEFVLCETLLCGAEVLGHIHRGAVAAEQQFAVEPVGGEVAPHATVGILHEDAHVESLLHQALAQQIGVVLVVNLVETDAQGLVGFVEAGEHPAVHHLPKGAHFLVALFPFEEHFVHLLVHGRIFLLEFGIGHVAVSHKVVALDAGALRSGAVHAFLPGIHALADMHSAVVHQGDLDHLVARGCQQTAHGISEEIVAHVAEMKGLVGVGRRELHHHSFACGRQLAVILSGEDACEALLPEQIAQAQVQEALHAVESCDFGAVFLKPGADGGCRGVGCCVRNAQKRENHKGEVSFELLAGYLHLHLFRGHFGSVEGLNCF